MIDERWAGAILVVGLLGGLFYIVIREKISEERVEAITAAQVQECLKTLPVEFRGYCIADPGPMVYELSLRVSDIEKRLDSLEEIAAAKTPMEPLGELSREKRRD